MRSTAHSRRGVYAPVCRRARRGLDWEKFHLDHREKHWRDSSLQHDENLKAERPSFVTHLECSATGEYYPADQVHNLSRVGKPLLVRYDLAGVREALSKDALARRPAGLWRYRELLPVRRPQDIVSLGEVVTPLVPMLQLERLNGGGEIIVK